MNYDVLATGSKGNAVIINGEILIDCGVPYKKLEPYVKNLKLVLLTHVHGDHFKPSTIKRLHQERPTLRFGCCEWMARPLLDAGVSRRAIDVYETGFKHVYWDFLSVEPIQLMHDAPNCGYKLNIPERPASNTSKIETLFYATDTGTLDGVEAKGFTLYAIEANHHTADIEARAAEKLAKGEFAYEFRAASTHLSYEQAMDWLYQNMGPKSQYILLHQHAEISERKKENA